MPSAPSSTAARRLVLVPTGPRSPQPSGGASRRYRLAHVTPAKLAPAAQERFAHLRHPHD